MRPRRAWMAYRWVVRMPKVRMCVPSRDSKPILDSKKSTFDIMALYGSGSKAGGFPSSVKFTQRTLDELRGPRAAANCATSVRHL